MLVKMIETHRVSDGKEPPDCSMGEQIITALAEANIQAARFRPQPVIGRHPQTLIETGKFDV